MAYNKHGPVHQGRKGQYVSGHWFDDHELLPDEEREMPPTVPDSVIKTHRVMCACHPCLRTPQEIRQRLKRTRSVMPGRRP